jgi:hypothetical protein
MVYFNFILPPTAKSPTGIFPWGLPNNILYFSSSPPPRPRARAL